MAEWFKPGLNQDELKKAYKALAKKYHPDISDDPEASEKMKEINFQFDEYFTHQARFEFAWASEARAREEAGKARRAILTMMYWDKEHEEYTTTIGYKFHQGYRSFWWGYNEPGYATFTRGIAKGPSWNGFNGGLAYVAYEEDKYGRDKQFSDAINAEYNIVDITRLPATITPASPEEVFYFNKDHWMDSKYDYFQQVDCRFGKGVILHIIDRNFGTPEKKRCELMMKVTLPDEFLLGHPDPKTNAKYEARSIQMVNVRYKMLGKLENVIELRGSDFPYMLYQDCTKQEFLDTHDVDYEPDLARMLQMKKVDYGWIPGCPDPMIEYYYRKGIVKFWQSRQNFRLMYGTFDMRGMEQNMELLSIDDAEMIQDFLEQINANFDQETRKMVKKGRIKLKV